MAQPKGMSGFDLARKILSENPEFRKVIAEIARRRGGTLAKRPRRNLHSEIGKQGGPCN